MSRAKDPITGLTQQQEAFAHAIALNGLNQADAYRQTYHPDNSLPDTIIENASRLAHDSNVLARIQQLKASLHAEAVTDAAKIVAELAKAGHGDASGPLRWADKVAALDKMAKILGLYKEQDGGRERQAPVTQVTVVLDYGPGHRGEVTETAYKVLEVAPGMETNPDAPRIEP